ncbi:HI0074 family nucleotidyltransferase substrate-binding subunit [Brumimicrobium oceani]|uniref:Nucleotidyltransferase n=1 Tax=Brumimicrobium oceani TaxID=2100725 RepID=A0A2U2X0D1_9FLAO|nr:HI0074 family nucleotidyltransferase substrate-binding subunit [Brumimicrobium oceani]PWH81229.1 nucleotidyltransferase [Brumimicrobium oceani]
MKKEKLNDSLQNFRNAFDRLKEATEIEKDRPLVAEGTIQRFEYVVELLWKTLNRGLKYEGVKIKPDTPRETMKEGFKANFLHNKVTWQELLDKRNESSHEYLHEEFIDDYYDEIISLTPHIEEVLVLLENRFK